ncbi:family transcriptional regulator AraC [Bifidobacterium stellenboschense]|uniref:Family transcriptional regulator AraC n=2 Tax=Bifidobacterium stellenboschense TaxID=762211 RepID=A0A087DPS1_9BIFI|nr:family transcriptional regulator AraC [Bifidobacterium stellenboschense]
MPSKKITVFSDMSEHIYYNVPGLPIYARCDPLSTFADYRCPCHWHRDLEFIRVVSGDLHYFVNGTVTVLHPGDGMVVNSSRLHYGFSPDRRESWFSCAVVSPTLFEDLTPATNARCARAFSQDMDDFLTLSPDVDWQRDLLMGVEEVIRLMPGGGVRRDSPTRITRAAGVAPADDDVAAADPLPAVAASIRLCDMVLDRFAPRVDGDGDEINSADDAETGNGGRMDGNGAGMAGVAGAVSGNGGARGANRRDLMTVLNMTGLVQQRFAEPLNLDDIAAAGGVSRSQCCILFRRYVRRTPNEFLTERRLEEAKRMLAGTSASVAETARACGFSSSSYFISVFRRRFGLTPNAYRGTR